MKTAVNSPNSAKSRRSAEHSSCQSFSFQHFSFTQATFFPRNPLFPSLWSSHEISQRPSSQKQFLSSFKHIANPFIRNRLREEVLDSEFM